MGVGIAQTRGLRGDERGQATVELAVAMPVVIIVAVIAVNALAFFGECAAFDRLARQAACAWAAAPEAGQDAGEVAACIQEELQRTMGAPNIAIAVRAESSPFGLMRFVARIEYAPTLFGLGMRREVFGVALPPLVHEVSMTVDAYKPGVLF